MDDLRSTIPGEPGRDYPIYADVPETKYFDCKDRDPGYYADTYTYCQVSICVVTAVRPSVRFININKI